MLCEKLNFYKQKRYVLKAAKTDLHVVTSQFTITNTYQAYQVKKKVSLSSQSDLEK